MFDAATIGEWLRQVLLPGLGSLIAAALFAVLRRYIKRLDDARLRRILLDLVTAAEQIFGPGRGAEKLEYVEEKLREQGLEGADRSEVEAAVYKLGLVQDGYVEMYHD